MPEVTGSGLGTHPAHPFTEVLGEVVELLRRQGGIRRGIIGKARLVPVPARSPTARVLVRNPFPVALTDGKHLMPNCLVNV